MPYFKDGELETKRGALMLSKKILGGVKGIAVAIEKPVSTVADWCSYPEKNDIPYNSGMKLSRITAINISDFLPGRIEDNEELNAGRLHLSVPVLQIESQFILQRTLPYLNYKMNERVILDSNYCLMAGHLIATKRMGHEDKKQRKVSAIRLDLRMLILGIRTLAEFSAAFSIDERLTIGTYLFEQWERLQKECAKEISQNPFWLKKPCQWGPDWKPFLAEKFEVIAQIVGVDSKAILLGGMQLYKEGILALRVAHNQGEISTDIAAKLSTLCAADQLTALSLHLQESTHPVH